MSMVTIAVEIKSGNLTPVEPNSLPEHGRGVLTVLGAIPGEGSPAFSVAMEADGLPVIRGTGGIISSAMVREIEGFVV